METILSCENLSYRYKTYQKSYGLKGTICDFFARKYTFYPAVTDFNMKVKTGEIVAILGANGAGKTTLLKMLVGILKPSFGNLECFSFDPFRRDAAFLGNIGVLFGQKSQLIWDLPPIDTLKELQHIYNVSTDFFNASVAEMTQLLNIKQFLNTPTRKLSLGERIKFDLICTLFYQPKIVFLDEPTIGLDVSSQREIHKFLLQMNQMFKTTIILTSHNTKDITTLAQRVVVIKNGKKYQDCSMVDFMKVFNDDTSYILKTKDGKKPIIGDANIKCVALGSRKYRISMKSPNSKVLIDIANLEYLKEDALDLEAILIKIFTED